MGFAAGDTITLTGTRTNEPVSPAERSAQIDRIRKDIRKYGAADPDWERIPTVKPVIEFVVVDDSGRVWVDPEMTEKGQTWDVFGTDGKQVAVVHSPIVLSALLPLHIRGDWFYGIGRDSNDVQTVFRGRIKRGN